MSDVEQILLVVGFFYLIEGLYWARLTGVVFVAQCFNSARPKVAVRHSWLVNESGGLLFGNLLPLGWSTAAQPLPFAISPIGITAFVRGGYPDDIRDARPDRCIRWDEIQSIEADTIRIRINGRLFATVGSPTLAKLLVAHLEQLRITPEAEREARIQEFLGGFCSVPIVRQKARELWRETRFLRILALSMFVFGFVVIPIRIYGKDSINWLQMAWVYLAILLATMLEFFIVHRRLRRKHGADRSKQLWTMLISPADTMHAADHLMREVLEESHPLAVGAVACRPAAAAELARQILLDLRHPRAQVEAPSGDAAEIEQWYSTRLEGWLLAATRDAGHDPATLLTPPAKSDSQTVAYCERCWGQYVQADARCTRCERRLIPFGETPPTAPELPPIPASIQPSAPAPASAADPKPEPKSAPESSPVAAPASASPSAPAPASPPTVGSGTAAGSSATAAPHNPNKSNKSKKKKKNR
ncbi:hypothetical protein [Tuwongella immobilis]|uniref:Membrane protein n=1 Tax=Tuwongella immobilis TaxID=692036 RepID=A0A6C2YUB4_9BACT|nr:hypothetical protein [Tuwongella immobilis]VIP04629.1 Membrane protein OS=Rhodopirellula sp. SWK7 GN=RRSWK_03231 PE=4 SV=1 [Tuwongella immobilis]VTS06619.1 Membrane protein OS=Rhodopirellula sp. SWK7 GN=RRSWK_03231 PE=4 SV=1 [Tuwongella immobilis]